MTGKIIEERDGHVVRLTMDNVAKRNAISQAMWLELGDRLQVLNADAQLRCIVLRGAGTLAFGSGADIEEFEQLRSSKEKGIAFGQQAHRAMQLLKACPVPTLAAIQGACIGGGLELAACCDIRIASADAKFGIPIARLGGVLAYPELEALLAIATPSVAYELLFEGRVLDAAQAAAKGLIARSVASDEFEAEIARSVKNIAELAPLSARWHKQFIARLATRQPLDEAQRNEAYDCFDTEDFQEGFKAFLEKRKPVFKGQ